MDHYSQAFDGHTRGNFRYLCTDCMLLCSTHLGTIGLIGTKSPPFFTLGRMMRALVNDFQDAPFYVDTTNKRVVVDFGNSLSIDQYGSILPNGLLVAVNLDNDTSLECPDNLLRLGHVQNTLPNWYRTTAGVQMFPASKPLSDDNMEKLAKYPLIVVEVRKKNDNILCTQIIGPLKGL